ncbi:hypothetical protein PTTG_28633 [Puccinia triticina 1-1 BBBD Race 1]|uniref:Uncharacterized protein n=1 Tax=Puccinia triticina (isolate 1-1 / race 1 (BBBD)) TaxID=630390 RepID=A0A180GCF8_PUCT1|nr:hypothetical protein PTTG_28633 [Puccinia triticina 1-1 BBBD Race 1]
MRSLPSHLAGSSPPRKPTLGASPSLREAGPSGPPERRREGGTCVKFVGIQARTPARSNRQGSSRGTVDKTQLLREYCLGILAAADKQARTLTVKAQPNRQTRFKTLTLAERLGPQTQEELLARTLEATATTPDPAQSFRQNKTKLLR